MLSLAKYAVAHDESNSLDAMMYYVITSSLFYISY